MSTATISCSTPDAVIRYEIGGVDPTESSPLYSSPVDFSGEIRAKAWKEGMEASDIAVAVEEDGYMYQELKMELPSSMLSTLTDETWIKILSSYKYAKFLYVEDSNGNCDAITSWFVESGNYGMRGLLLSIPFDVQTLKPNQEVRIDASMYPEFVIAYNPTSNAFMYSPSNYGTDNYVPKYLGFAGWMES